MSPIENALHILPLIDLTSLNESDTPNEIIQLCKTAQTPHGNTAAVCIFPQFIPMAKSSLPAEIKIATVTNFPQGSPDITKALNETAQAAEAGADEIDLVIPYLAIINDDKLIAEKMVSAVRRLLGNRCVLKVILESGVLHQPNLIQLASDIAIDNGADFIKTSTGKVSVNATLDAAFIMLNAIARKNPQCGFKAAGGIRTIAEADEYLILAKEILGADWINPTHFRFGASSLLQDVLATIEGTKSQQDASAY